ncbi:MAG: MetQ/NlpA family ABC transporter substrate-binding protein [Peptoniphilaceae bacterium]|nr:MetQ/NlpA family ABC transporter substrate-binding protein [Peptoniphilaceae bacterium]MDD7383738.1 MetQ/NlpA family ABC transporter substrate-binding protein [Peptoniphilaceae bacterium]MDY3737862.1 MetQ/NlpA family ABC transporter substrate-binding protein [Peptoniphilaceae bacterium]
MKNLIKKLALASLSLALGVGLYSKSNAEEETWSKDKPVEVKVGVVGEDTRVWDDIAKRLEGEGINIKIVSFTDYNQPNEALLSGDVDLNSFQHHSFLNNFLKEKKAEGEIVPIGDTLLAPFGFYSNNIKDIKDIKEGDTIVVPDDPTNETRALLLLQKNGLIKVKGTIEDLITKKDITENPKNLKIEELSADQTARSLSDKSVALAGINSGMAVDAGLSLKDDSVIAEEAGEELKPYINLIAARKEDKDKKVFKRIVEEYQSETTEKLLDKLYGGNQIEAWNFDK